MKTTLDLLDALVKRVKLLALHEGKKLKDTMAELLRRGLAAAPVRNPDVAEPLIRKDKKTGLPVIRCKKAAPPHQELTAERVADILLAQETEWHHADKAFKQFKGLNLLILS